MQHIAHCRSLRRCLPTAAAADGYAHNIAVDIPEFLTIGTKTVWRPLDCFTVILNIATAIYQWLGDSFKHETFQQGSKSNSKRTFFVMYYSARSAITTRRLLGSNRTILDGGTNWVDFPCCTLFCGHSSWVRIRSIAGCLNLTRDKGLPDVLRHYGHNDDVE